MVSDNVVKLVPNNALCPDAPTLCQRIRELADRIEAGEFGEIHRACIIMDGQDQVMHRCYGQQTSNAYLIGLLEYAKAGMLPRGEG